MCLTTNRYTVFMTQGNKRFQNDKITIIHILEWMCCILFYQSLCLSNAHRIMTGGFCMKSHWYEIFTLDLIIIGTI